VTGSRAAINTLVAMAQVPPVQLMPLQQAILNAVRYYPGRFNRSGLAKMLVGTKSSPDADLPEYGSFATRSRKSVTYDIDVLLQQGYLEVNGRQNLVLPQPLPHRQ
jgi:hypothetical protein